jgi:hypothetical protein
MKNFTLIALLTFLLSASFCFSQKGIGTNKPHASAILELKSINKGFLLPRLTKVQRDAIAAPVQGLVVYCIDCSPRGLQVYDGAGWLGSAQAVNTNIVSDNSGTAYKEVKSTETDRIWLDRNLGATQVATSSSDADSFGDLYQWGRNTDGHQLRTSTKIEFTATSGEPNSNQFIVPLDGTNNNWTDYLGENNLWQGSANDNNPCPSGYRLPTKEELRLEINEFSSGTTPTEMAFASFLKLPAAEIRRIDGSFYEETRYWTSTTSGNVSSSLVIVDSLKFVSYGRSVGASVRCIKSE